MLFILLCIGTIIGITMIFTIVIIFMKTYCYKNRNETIVVDV